MRGKRRVGVNLLWLVPGVVGGSEEYTLRTLRAVAEIDHPDIEIDLFVTQQLLATHPDLADTFPVHISVAPRGGRPARVAKEATHLAGAGRALGLDLWHHAGGTLPIDLRRGGPQIPVCLTIHDVQPLVFPERFGPVKRRYLEVQLPRSARLASVITTPSEYSKGEIARLLRVDSERIHVVPHGLSASTAPTSQERIRVRSRYGVGDRYLIYPAKTFAHKNHALVIDALAHSSHPDLELVLTGGEGEAESEVRTRIRDRDLGHRVHRLGRIPRSDLDALIAASIGVVMPSSYEGFGAPVLEAMAAGRPVLAADATAIPDLVGSAGRLLPPEDELAWSRAIDDLVDNPGSSLEFGRLGRERSLAFSAEASAHALLAAYRATERTS